MTRKDTASSKKLATPRCRLCRSHRRYNDETVAAIRESERIMSEIVSGQRKPRTLDAFLLLVRTGTHRDLKLGK